MAKLQQIISKSKAEKTFSGLHGVKIIIQPGEKNWIPAEQVEYLSKNSKGFNYNLGLKKGGFEIPDADNAVRDETEKEKNIRLKMLEKGAAVWNRMKPNKNAKPVDTEAELATFKESLVKESESALSLFQDFLKDVSLKLELGTDEKLQASSEKLMSDQLETFEKKLTESVESFDSDKLTRTVDSSVESKVDEIIALTMKKFAAKLDAEIDRKFKKFESKIRAASLYAKKGLKE